MSENKASLAAVSTFADHEVIMPPNRLRKAVQKVAPGSDSNFDPVARAEAALAELADDFALWMEQECVRLDGALAIIKSAGPTPANRDALFRAAHDIKGQAATFGFPLVAPVADSLCRLIEYIPDIARLPMALVEQHVGAIRAITHRNTHGDIDTNAVKLAEKLRHVTDEFLVHENSDRPDYLESILSPALAPSAPAS